MPGVTRVRLRPTPPAAGLERRSDRLQVARIGDRALDGTVMLLASWTVVYHFCLIARLGVWWAIGLELLALGGWVYAARRARTRLPAIEAPKPPAEGDPTVDVAMPAAVRMLALCSALCAVGAGLLFAFRGSWAVSVVLWMAAAVGATAWAALRVGKRGSIVSWWQARPEGRVTRVDDWVALGWAGAMAVLASILLRPNPDDLYYVNLSQWVVDHGTYPTRDTIFSDQVFPMASWPPMASYDALGGTIAKIVGVDAGSVVYVVVPPVVAFLSVLALRRLLRVWRTRLVSVALSVSLVFLLFDGGLGYAPPGNLFVTRLWQGKVILLCLLIPILLTYAVRYVERPTWSRAVWMFAGGVAAVGLSTSAMFLVPLVALAGVAPLAWGRPAAAVRGFFAMAAYPLGAGLVTVALGGHSADDFDSRELYRFEPEWFGREIFLDGGIALVAVGCVLLGAFLVPHTRARLTTGLLAVATGITFIPEVTDLSYDTVGLGPTLWRVSWVASIAALVGVAGSTLASGPAQRLARIAAPIALVGLICLTGPPIFTESGGTYLKAPWEWQRGENSTDAADIALDPLRPGDVVLAPQDVAVTIDVMTTRVKTVAPRDYFMDYLRDEPGFHFDDRLTLVEFANLEEGEAFDERAVARALDVVGVDEVCLPVDAEARRMFVEGLGYSPSVATQFYSCLTR
jgi:hypothetical protein